MPRCFLALLALLALLPPLTAQEKPRWPEDVIRLNVTPAAAPVPALRYQLLPDARDLQAGNAATAYFRASASLHPTHRQAHVQEALNQWLEAEKKPPQVPERLRFLKDYWPLQEIDRAARREFCDWELNERVRREGLIVQVPDVQQHREWANLLTLRCRLELEQKEFSRAVYTCQTGLAFGRHIAHAPALFSMLVGKSLCDMTLQSIQEIIHTPGSPNLYWALTALPRPLIDLRRSMQGDRLWLDALLEGFDHLETEPLSPEQAAELRQRFARMILNYTGSREFREHPEAMSTFFVLRSYPSSRRWLLEQGKPAALVDRMPTFQVVAVRALAQYREMTDDVLKLLPLSFLEARPHLQAHEQRMVKSRARLDTFPLAAVLLPAYFRVIEANAQTERKLDLLRVIEALRLYAAQHGHWPASLEEIKEVPVPRDCLTGKPFVYHLAGSKATLLAPSPNEPALRQQQVHFELTLVK